MKHVFVAALFALTCIATVANAQSVPSNVPVQTKEPFVFTDEHEAVLKKSMNLERTICSVVYPAPKTPLDCIEQMTVAIEKEFPGSLKKAEELGIADVPADFPNVPGIKQIWQLNARIIAACQGDADVNKCTERAYRTLPTAFDPHSAYISVDEYTEMRQSSTGSFSGIGLEVGGKKNKGDPVIAINPMEGSPAEKAGILPGDLIVGISKDGTARGMRLIEAYETLSEAVKDIRGVTGTQVRLLVQREGETARREFTITRGTILTRVVKETPIIDGNKRYGVIAIRQFEGQSCKKTEEAYKRLTAGGKLDGLIVSVERNPGGYLHEAHCILDLFTDAKSFVLQRDRDSIDPFIPCRMFIPGITECIGGIKQYPGDIAKGLPILVMVNGLSASASEIFSAGMKHMSRGVIAGTPTFQKGTAQTIIPLGDGSAVKVTGSEFLIGTENDWIPVQCLGVEPDILFDRGMDPKDKDGKRLTDCGLEHSLRSGGPMPNATVHKPIKEANPAHYAAGERMLEAYKKHAAKEDQKMKKQDELLKKLEERTKKEEKK